MIRCHCSLTEPNPFCLEDHVVIIQQHKKERKRKEEKENERRTDERRRCKQTQLEENIQKACGSDYDAFTRVVEAIKKLSLFIYEKLDKEEASDRYFSADETMYDWYEQDTVCVKCGVTGIFSRENDGCINPKCKKCWEYLHLYDMERIACRHVLF